MQFYSSRSFHEIDSVVRGFYIISARSFVHEFQISNITVEVVEEAHDALDNRREGTQSQSSEESSDSPVGMCEFVFSVLIFDLLLNIVGLLKYVKKELLVIQSYSFP